jgi:hypothetical protein
MTTKERWGKIAERVGGGKTMKECAERFKALRDELRENKARAKAVVDAKKAARGAMTKTERAKMDRLAAREKMKEENRRAEEEHVARKERLRQGGGGGGGGGGRGDRKGRQGGQGGSRNG